MKIFLPDNFREEREYIIDIIFNEFLGLNYELDFYDKNDYLILLNSKKKIIIKDAFWSKISEKEGYLLPENIPNTIYYAENSYLIKNNLPVIYGTNECKTSNDEIICGLDIFASSFFMLTRWEEYVLKERDIHNRFPDEMNFMQRMNIHLRPIVNEYVEMLWNMIWSSDKSLKRKNRNYKAFITHDIDNIAKYDSIMKFLRALAGDLFSRKSFKALFLTVVDFININVKGKNDNYDTFDFLMNVSEKNGLQSRFYFIPGKKGETDVRYDIEDKKIKIAIKKIQERNHITGLHGSYDSYNNPDKYRSELKRLEKLSIKIKENRQHYLRFENPITWELMENNAIEIDSSMGFSNDFGFRTGTCYEYSLFNILKREKLKLKEYTLTVMDTSLIFKGLSHLEFEQRVKEIYDEVKLYSGNFVLLWHNSNFNTYELKKFKGMYERIIKLISY